MSVHALYRFFDAGGELLYVGITLNPAARWKQHSHDKTWWTEVANIVIEPHPDRAAVLEAERLAIVTEKPRYNVVYNQPGATAKHIQWTCVECGKAVADGTGYLWFSEQDLRTYQEQKRVWDESHAGQMILGGDALFSFPAEVEWMVHHAACDPVEEYGYLIRVENARTHADLLSWTAHLLGKQWLTSTNWEQVLYSVVGHDG